MTGDGSRRMAGGGEGLAAGSAFGTTGGKQATPLGPGPEFDLIRGFLQGQGATHPAIRVGPGDDAAVVDAGPLALSCDLSLEGVHFRRDWLSPYWIGYRSTMASLSDLAAMAARPVGVLVSLAVTPADAEQLASEIMRGVADAVRRLGGVLLGGDLTRSPAPIVIDVTAVGEGRDPVRRIGARSGDEVWVTGALGGPARALEALLAGKTPPEPALDRYRAPLARTAEALWLRERGMITAMIDVSDGLAGDASHIAAASGVAVILEAARIPLHAGIASVTPERGLDFALFGGDEYELCLTAAAGSVEPIRSEFAEEFDCPLTRVGSVAIGSGVHLLDREGTRRPVERHGFQHFRSNAQ